jgi:hypothetical protein
VQTIGHLARQAEDEAGIFLSALIAGEFNDRNTLEVVE